MAVDETVFDCVNVDNLLINGEPIDDHIKAIVEACIEAGLVGGGDIYAAIKACIEAGLVEGGDIYAAIKACIGDAGGSDVQIKQETTGGITTTTIIVDSGTPVLIKSWCPDPPVVVAHTPAVIGDPVEADILAAATAAAAGKPPMTLIKVDVAPNDCRYTYRVEADGSLCLIEEPNFESYFVTARSVGSNFFYGNVDNLGDVTPVVCINVPNKSCKTYFARIELGVHAEIHPVSPVGAVGVQAMLSLNGGTTFSNVAHNITSNEADSFDTLVDSWNDYAQRIAIPPGGRQFCFKGVAIKTGTINDDAYSNLPIIEFSAQGGHNQC